MKRILKSCFFVCCFFMSNIKTEAQTGINFQGVARNSNNVVVASQPISLRFSILQGSATGTVEYTEIRKVTTNGQGLFTAVIGDGEAISNIGNFNSINWKNTPKFLKIELDVNAGTNFTTIGATQFQYVGYAQFAKSVDAENLIGVLPVEKGGTGVVSISALKASLEIDKAFIGLSNVDNTSDANKPISVATQTALDSKANTNNLNISLSLKENLSNKSIASDLGGMFPSDDLYSTQKAVKLYVDGQVNSGGVQNGSILTRHLADGSITNLKLGELIATTNGGTGTATATANTFFSGPDGVSGAPIFRNIVAADLPNDAAGYIQNGSLQQSSSSFNISDNGVIGKKLTVNGFDIGVGGAGTELTNIAIGKEALIVVAPVGGVGGSENIAIGTNSLKLNSIGASNSVIGHYAMQLNTEGANNTSVGAYTLNNNSVGSANTAIGLLSLTQNTIGNANTAIGVSSLGNNRSGNNNTAIGFGADVGSNNLTNATAIGYGAIVASSNTIQLGNGSVADVKTNGVITANGFIGPLSGNATTSTSATTATTAGNITATSNSTLTSLSNLTTVGTITSGVWSGTAINANALAGTTLKSTIVNSSLTSLGTISNLMTGSIINSGKVIVGATSPASSSAVLEASSTTQGFLPPRMTKAQRDAITSPIAGLMIWCSDNFGGELEVYNGSIWVNMNGFSNSTLNIGDYYQGGKIAYILVSGDPGFDPTTPHGLIAAVSDQSTGIRWYNGSYISTGATGLAIGTGLSNTNAIIASQGSIATSYAAGLARSYKGGGYTDWYLPSREELFKLFLNRGAIGGFNSTTYWSSSEDITTSSWLAAWGYAFDFDPAIAVNNYKSYLYGSVRAIRSF